MIPLPVTTQWNSSSTVAGFARSSDRAFSFSTAESAFRNLVLRKDGGYASGLGSAYVPTSARVGHQFNDDCGVESRHAGQRLNQPSSLTGSSDGRASVYSLWWAGSPKVAGSIPILSVAGVASGQSSPFCGVEQRSARRAHNPKVTGSSPVSATNFFCVSTHEFVALITVTLADLFMVSIFPA